MIFVHQLFTLCRFVLLWANFHKVGLGKFCQAKIIATIAVQYYQTNKSKHKQGEPGLEIRRLPDRMIHFYFLLQTKMGGPIIS